MKLTKHLSLLLIFSLTLGLVSCDLKSLDTLLEDSGGALSTDQIAQGLKEALEKGAKEGAKQLASTDGYYKSAYKIFLPEEAQEVASKLRAIPGFSDFEDKMILKINRAAEDAAKSAAPIFVGAIKQMTINDAWNILKGSDNAATQYLQDKTTDKLYNSFQPKIRQSLNKFGAVDYWSDAINTYNKLPFVKKMNPDLDDFVTTKALTGLFSEVAKKEKDIRENPFERTTELMRKVFAQQD